VPHDIDLFKEEEQMVRMTFAEHLEDLRRHLFRALVGFVPALIIGLFFGAPIVRYMREPARDALLAYYREELQAREERARESMASGEPVEVVEVTWYVPREVLEQVVAGYLAERGGERPEDGSHGAGKEGAKERGSSSDAAAKGASRGAEQAKTPSAPTTLPGNEPRSRSTTEPKGEEGDAKGQGKEKSRGASSGEESDETLWYESVLRKLGLRWDRVPEQGEAVHAAGRLVRERSLTKEELSRDYVEVTLLTPRAALESAASLPDLDSAVISLGPYETFTAFLRASLLAGFVIASPWVFYQIWAFIAAGLYSYEKRVVYRFLPLAVGLFLGGVAFCFFVVLPVILNFLLSFNRWIGIKPQIRLSEWMGFATLLPLMFGLSFQLPIVMLALERVGIFSVDDYRAKRRVAILVLAFVSMMLTPPDPGSMLAMLLPAIGLYELGIWMCRRSSPAPATRPLPSS